MQLLYHLTNVYSFQMIKRCNTNKNQDAMGGKTIISVTTTMTQRALIKSGSLRLFSYSAPNQDFSIKLYPSSMKVCSASINLTVTISTRFCLTTVQLCTGLEGSNLQVMIPCDPMAPRMYGTGGCKAKTPTMMKWEEKGLGGVRAAPAENMV